MQNRYRVQANATENKGVLAFVFTREESGRSPSSN
jgi:hypothetical protein